MFKRLLILTIVSGFCSNSIAYQLLNEEETNKQQTQIAAALVEGARISFYNQVEHCLELSNNKVLLPEDFSGIALNEKELKTIILYYSSKTLKDCVGDLADKYLMAEMVARQYKVNSYSVDDDPSASKILATGASLSIADIRYMPDYLAIDEAKRSKIEKIAKLKEMFNLDESIKALLNK